MSTGRRLRGQGRRGSGAASGGSLIVSPLAAACPSLRELPVPPGGPDPAPGAAGHGPLSWGAGGTEAARVARLQGPPRSAFTPSEGEMEFGEAMVEQAGRRGGATGSFTAAQGL